MWPFPSPSLPAALQEPPPLRQPPPPSLRQPSLRQPSLQPPSLQQPSLQQPSLQPPSLQQPPLQQPPLQPPLQPPSLQPPSLQQVPALPSSHASLVELPVSSALKEPSACVPHSRGPYRIKTVDRSLWLGAEAAGWTRHRSKQGAWSSPQGRYFESATAARRYMRTGGHGL